MAEQARMIGMKAKVAPAPVARAASTQTRGTMAYYASRILGKLGLGSAHRYIFIELEGQALPAMPRGYDMRFLGADDEKLAKALPAAQVRAWRFNQGCLCLGAFRGEDLAGIAWFAAGQFLEDEVRATYQVPEHCVWDLGMEVLPAYRGSRAVLAVLAALGEAMRQHQAHRTISRIADHNLASLKAHEKLGCRVIGTAVIIRIGPMQLTFSRLAGLLHISFSDDSRPMFRFS